jgi:drug/metabolite transporter (DMT)-like permease
MTRASNGQLWAALLTVYVVWGSTYLAIKLAVRTLPPLLAAGSRFVVAGLLLAVILAVLRRPFQATRGEALAAAGVGIALLSVGVGLVHVAELRIDSSVAAMIAGSVPLQVVVWRTLAGERVRPATIEMLAGGAALLVVATATGELADLDRADLEAGPLLAWAYLVVFGSLLAFTAYAWLLHHAPISRVVTHQYVNPLVAVALGALVLHERPGPEALLGAILIVAAVAATLRIESGDAAAVATAEPAGAGLPGTRADPSG